MDGETNGGQEATQGAQDQAQQQGQEQQETQQGQSQVGGDATDYEKQIAERDEKIATLEAQVVEAAKTPRRPSSCATRSPSSRPRARATASTSSCSSRACTT